MQVSVVIPSYSRPEFLVRTVQEVISQKHPALCEIIIIDQTPLGFISPDFQRKISSFKNQVHVKYIHETKANLPAARNKALSIAQGEVVIMIDDDVLLAPKFIELHLTCYRENEDVICVAGLPYHRKDDCLHRINQINLTNFKKYTFPHFKETSKEENWKGLIVGANHSLLRKYAILSGGYDEQMRGASYYEDSDFILRQRIIFPEKRYVYEPNAFVIHLRAPIGGARRKDIRKRDSYLMTLSSHIFMWRHTESIERVRFLFKTIRMGPLRKDNVIQFWKMPSSIYGFTKSLLLAYTKSKKPKLYAHLQKSIH